MWRLFAQTFIFRIYSMKYIRKDVRNEPRSLRTFQATPGADYNGLHGSVKNDIRAVLSEEQGFICAYCMSRIEDTPKGMEIEHFITQTRHPSSLHSEAAHKENQLLYINMLGTCHGARRCSHIRENMPLTIDPRSPSCERLIRFDKSGVASSTQPEINTDIETLQLNKLTDQRRQVIDKAREELKKIASKGAWNNSILDREIERWKSLKRTRYGLAYEPYCMAAVHYLESKKT